MPKLWTETIDAHRRAVHDAALDAVAGLVRAHGLRAVTMGQIADATGVGRATLYKYFPDVEAILDAWHERQLERHLGQLAAARDRAPDDRMRLQAVLEAFARAIRESAGHHGPDLATLLWRDERHAQARRQVHDMIRQLIAEAGRAGDVRVDVPADELASYCEYALEAAAGLESEAAVGRLVAVTLAGLKPSG